MGARVIRFPLERVRGRQVVRWPARPEPPTVRQRELRLLAVIALLIREAARQQAVVP